MKNLGELLPENARILVAEDHPLNQMFIRKSLERLGVGHFEVVANGLEAFKQYSSAPWDLILMDCHMPELSGYDATKQIRVIEKKTGSHVFIIAMTANTLEGERQKCIDCGMDEYISKPINISELKHILSQWLKFEDEMEATPQAKTVWNHQAPVDLSKLRSFSESGSSMEKEMVRLFIEQSDKNIALMKQSNAKKNHKALKETAHMFKGGAISIGAMALGNVCDRIEHFEGTDGGRMALIESVGKEYSRVKHYLEELGLLDKQA